MWQVASTGSPWIAVAPVHAQQDSQNHIDIGHFPRETTLKKNAHTASGLAGSISTIRGSGFTTLLLEAQLSS